MDPKPEGCMAIWSAIETQFVGLGELAFILIGACPAHENPVPHRKMLISEIGLVHQFSQAFEPG